MTLDEAIATLERYQSWRLGDDSEMLNPKTISMAINTVLDNVKEIKVKIPSGGFVVPDPTKENDKI